MSAVRSGIDATLRFELVSEEGRPLFVSYLVASLLALTWLALVRLMPSPLQDIRIVDEPPVIIFEPGEPAPVLPPLEVRPDAPAAGTRMSRPNTGPGREIFSGNTGLVDAGRILRGIKVSPPDSRGAEPGGKKVGLETGTGFRTPGRSQTEAGFSVASEGVGTVRSGNVSRSGVTIAPPEVRPVVAGTTAGNATEVGHAARAHVPQLERCYHAEGLTRNAALAGLVRLAVTVEGGRVTAAEIASRSWSGAGAAETESCLVRTVRGWRLGTGDARIVLPLSFTSPRTAPR